MAEGFSDSQIAELRESFSRFDQNGDGSISREELKIIMKDLGQNLSDRELNRMIEEVDKNNSGTIEFPEFLAMIKGKIQAVDISKEIEEAFRLFDTKNDGHVNVSELRHAMKLFGTNLSDEQVEEMIQKADHHKTGAIDYKEFIKRMTME